MGWESKTGLRIANRVSGGHYTLCSEERNPLLLNRSRPGNPAPRPVTNAEGPTGRAHGEGRSEAHSAKKKPSMAEAHSLQPTVHNVPRVA